MTAIRIRKARPDESEMLSAIAMAAKSHWGYAAEQVERWREALRITAASIEADPTWVADLDGSVIGVVQIQLSAGIADLNHLWVSPSAMGQGAGTALFEAALRHAREAGATALSIDADPYAAEFYRNRGATQVGEVAAPIPGEPQRVRPQLRIPLN